MASNAVGGGAVLFWRAARMTYITYSNICFKEPHKTEAISREKVHFALSKWVDGKPEKPRNENFDVFGWEVVEVIEARLGRQVLVFKFNKKGQNG